MSIVFLFSAASVTLHDVGTFTVGSGEIQVAWLAESQPQLGTRVRMFSGNLLDSYAVDENGTGWVVNSRNGCLYRFTVPEGNTQPWSVSVTPILVGSLGISVPMKNGWTIHNGTGWLACERSIFQVDLLTANSVQVGWLDVPLDAEWEVNGLQAIPEPSALVLLICGGLMLRKP